MSAKRIGTSPTGKGIKNSPPQSADWCLEVIFSAEIGQTSYHHRYFQGPELDEIDWRDVALYITGGTELIEFTARVTPQGRHADKAEAFDVVKAKP